MKKWELINIIAPYIALAHRNSISIADIEKDGIYDEYCSRRSKGEKSEAIVYDICERKGLSRRGFFRYLRKMKEEANIIDR